MVLVVGQIATETFYERGNDFEAVCRECSEIADRINSVHRCVQLPRLSRIHREITV